jgi:hypothetical protein
MSRRRWLPSGLREVALGHGRAVDESLGAAVVGDVDPWVHMPLRLVPDAAPAAAPTPWADGHLCVDLGPDDTGTWDTFRSVVAVTPFREAREPVSIPPAPEPVRVDLRGVRVVDLTSMWAGPLCTELLARAGASVVKIEPAARPDGLRFGDGDDGTGKAPMFVELNRGKDIVDIDLRHCSTRGGFERLLRDADLLVTSLSARALHNLGIDAATLAAQHQHLCTLAITAFPSGWPEADWVAYGTGVHAAMGLGIVAGEPVTPSFSYPDPLAGLLACRTALAQLGGTVGRHQRVSLAEAVVPLLESR